MIRIIFTTTVLMSLLVLSSCDKEKIVTTTETVREIEYVTAPGDTLVLVDTVRITDSGGGQKTDTVFITDTIGTTQSAPGENLAYAALQYYSDSKVIDLVNQEFGMTDGWIYYLSVFQSNLTTISAGTYEISGYIDYWTPDWSGYYPIEYVWRVTYTSGDPSDPTNWQMTEPPAGPVSGRKPGMHLIRNATRQKTSVR